MHEVGPQRIAEVYPANERAGRRWHNIARGGMGLILTAGGIAASSQPASAANCSNNVHAVIDLTMSDGPNGTATHLDFNASRSTDTNPGATITEYSWGFNNNDFAQGASVSRDFRVNQPVNVGLYVNDSQDCSNVTSKSIAPGVPILNSPAQIAAYENNAWNIPVSDLAAYATDVYAPDINAGTTHMAFKSLDSDPAKAPQHGSVALSADGNTVVYTPNKNYYGKDVFLIAVQTQDGRFSAPEEVDVMLKLHELPAIQLKTSKDVGWCAIPHSTDGKLSIELTDTEPAGSYNTIRVAEFNTTDHSAPSQKKVVTVHGGTETTVDFNGSAGRYFVGVSQPGSQSKQFYKDLPGCDYMNPRVAVLSKRAVQGAIHLNFDTYHESHYDLFKAVVVHGKTRKSYLYKEDAGWHDNPEEVSVPKGRSTLKIFYEKFDFAKQRFIKDNWIKMMRSTVHR